MNIESFEYDFGDIPNLVNQEGDITSEGMKSYFRDKLMRLDKRDYKGYTGEDLEQSLMKNLNNPNEEPYNDFTESIDEALKVIVANKLGKKLDNINLSIKRSNILNYWMEKTNTLGTIKTLGEFTYEAYSTIYKFHNLDKYEEIINNMENDEIPEVIIEDANPEVKVEEVLTMDPEVKIEKIIIDDPTIPQSRVVETPSTSFFSQFLNLNFSKKDVLGLIEMDENEDFNFIVLD